MTTTRYFRWDHASAPGLSGTPGDFKALMKALLIGSGGVAYGSGGTAKTAAGWTNAFPADETSTKIVFRNSLAAGGSGCYLRIDDSNAQYAVVSVYESMSDIDTGTGSAASGNRYIPKSAAASGSARAWVICADERTLWGCVHANTSSPSNGNMQYLHTFGAGDLDMFIPGDPSCFISANATNATASSATCALFGNSYQIASIQAGGISVSRNSSLVASPTSLGVHHPRAVDSTTVAHAIGGSTTTITSPAPGFSGDIAIGALGIDAGTLRCRLRGLFVPYTSLSASTTLGSTKSMVGRPGGSLMVAMGGQVVDSGNAANNGRVFIETALTWD